MKVVCRTCNANLQARNELAGKTAKCPKCGNPVAVPNSVPRSKGTVPLATDRQNEFAASLGIDFPPDINRREISELIDAAVQKQDDERFDRLEEFSRRESDAWREMREEVLAEIDEKDCRLSIARPKQMVDELANRNRGAILISFDFNDVDDFDHLSDVNFAISFTDDMTESDMRSVVMSIGLTMLNKLPK
jgi:hypothetical protein